MEHTLLAAHLSLPISSSLLPPVMILQTLVQISLACLSPLEKSGPSYTGAYSSFSISSFSPLGRPRPLEGLLSSVACFLCSAVLARCSSLPSPWEKAMAPHSSTVAWKIPWMEEPGRLQSMGSRRVRHD